MGLVGPCEDSERDGKTLNGSEQRRMLSDLHLKMMIVFVFYCYIKNDHKRSG